MILFNRNGQGMVEYSIILCVVVLIVPTIYSTIAVGVQNSFLSIGRGSVYDGSVQSAQDSSGSVGNSDTDKGRKKERADLITATDASLWPLR